MDYKNLKSGDSVVLIGCGGFSIELYSLLNQLSINVIGYIGEQSQKDLFSSLRFLGDDSEIKYWLQYEMLVAIGEPKIRKKIFNLVEKNGGALATFIHPNSYISGVFYIKCDDGDGISFNKNVYNQIKIEVSKLNIFNADSWNFGLKTGDVILFPSYLQHAVKIRNIDKSIRTSLAFNVFVKGNLGSNQNLTELILQ